MGPWPTQGDEKHLHQPLSMEAPPSPLSSRAKPRDLQFCGPLLEMFFDRAKRSREPALSEVEWGPAVLSTNHRMRREAPALPFVIPSGR